MALPSPASTDCTDGSTAADIADALLFPWQGDLENFFQENRAGEVTKSRKRGPRSKTYDRSSRAAEHARRTRRRHKEYVHELEERADSLANANEELLAEKKEKDSALERLSAEVRYLRSILEKQSALSRLLNKIDLSEENATFLQDHDYGSVGGGDNDAGVCLHVSKSRISLEMCAQCSIRANKKRQV
eukprot:m.4079 g.4079  ORF g.4079 m.4079 type:complete len:188 (+) comp10179_c0_seq2:99-662(+)